MILVFYAFPREVAPFARRLKNRRALSDPGLTGFSCELGATEMVAIGTGIGLTRAAESAHRAFAAFPGAEMVLGTGVAGALSAGLSAGDLVLADRILASDAANESAEHVAAVSDEHRGEIGRYLRIAGIPFSTGAILTTHRVLPTGADKRGAKERTGAIAVDMETAALARAAREHNVSFAVLRAVMDTVDEEVVGAAMADEHGRVRPLAAMGFLARNPGVMLKLPRMMKSLGRATESIADALEAIAHRGEPPARRHKPSRGNR